MAKRSSSFSKPSHHQKIGRKGGEAGTGKAKARTSEQARAAVKVRWDNWRKRQQQPPEESNPEL